MQMNGMMRISPAAMGVGGDRHFDNTPQWQVNQMGACVHLIIMITEIIW